MIRSDLISRALKLQQRCDAMWLTQAAYHLGMFAAHCGRDADLAEAWSAVGGAMDGLRIAARPCVPDPDALAWVVELRDQVHALRLDAIRSGNGEVAA